MLLNEMIHEEELLNDQLNEAIHNWQEKLQDLCSELLLDLYKVMHFSVNLFVNSELFCLKTKGEKEWSLKYCQTFIWVDNLVLTTEKLMLLSKESLIYLYVAFAEGCSLHFCPKFCF